MSSRHHRVVDIDGELVDGRCLSWKKAQLSLVQIELQVLCQHPMREDCLTLTDSCFYLGFSTKPR